MVRENRAAMRIITLTTDFGLADPFVGIMKGVILGIAPDVCLVDLCHEIPPQDVVAGALSLEAATLFFVTGTIHVGVVDPESAVRVQPSPSRAGARSMLGLTTVLFELALERDPMVRAVTLTNTANHLPEVSATFHGRDIFAPVAAHLALGTPLQRLGQPIDRLARLNLPQPTRVGDSIQVHVLHADRFGNLVTDLDAAGLADWLRDRPTTGLKVSIGQQIILGLSLTFAYVPIGRPLAYIAAAAGLRSESATAAPSQEFGICRWTTIELSA